VAKCNKPETAAGWHYKAPAAVVWKQPALLPYSSRPASNRLHAISRRSVTCMKVQGNVHVRSRLVLCPLQSRCGRLHDSAVEARSRLLSPFRVCKRAYLLACLVKQEVHAVRLLLNLLFFLLLGICPQLSLLLCQALLGLHQAQCLRQTKPLSCSRAFAWVPQQQ